MNDEENVMRKFLNLPKDKQQILCDIYGELLTSLKADWEA